MSNYNGSESNPIGNSSWNMNAINLDKQASLQNRIDAAKKRKQNRQAQLLAENKDNTVDTVSMPTGQSQFITDYQSETRRWTTNTATTRFFPPKNVNTNANDNNNTNASNTDANQNQSTLNTRMFTDSFLQSQQPNSTLNQNNNSDSTNMQPTASRTQNSRSYYAVPPIQSLQRQNLSSATQSQTNARASNSIAQRRPISQSMNKNDNVANNVSFQMENPMHNLQQHDDIKLQQQHTDRIFHATDSLPGHRARLGRRLQSESSFGIIPASSVATSINANNDTSSQKFGDPPRLHTIHEQKEISTGPKDANHNHNSNQLDNTNSNTRSNISNVNAKAQNTVSRPSQQFVFSSLV